MKPQHYLIFHPDRARIRTKVQANALIDGQPSDWHGYVWVDNPSGNEDPFVFSERWLYSYCHATQIRRRPRLNSEYVAPGSYLFFCSGDAANERTIQLDTVFVVDRVARWPANQQGLPEEFKEHYKNNSSDLWQRHFRYPFNGCHEGKYTYVSRQQFDRTEEYSFLPMAKSGDRVSFKFGVLTADLQRSISDRVFGKRPVPVTEGQKTELLKKTLSLTEVQVLHSLTRQVVPDKRTSHLNGSCGASLPCESTC